MSFHLNLIAEYNTIFPELDETIPQLVEGIPKEIFLLSATTFLGTDSFKKEISDWSATLRYWFRESNLEFAKNIASRIIDNYENKLGEHPSLLSPITNLNLLQLGLSLPEEGRDENLPEEQVEINLFKIYLLLNRLTTEKYVPGKEYIYEHYSASEIPPILLLAMGFSMSDLINYFYASEFYCQSVKAFFLFSFLKTHKSFQYVEAKFCEFFEIKSLKEYYGALLPLIQAIATKDKDGFFEFNIIKDAHYEKNHKFISKLAIQHYSPEDDIDYKEIRSQPFISVGVDKYRITHPIFFSDKIFKGIFFELSRLNSDAPAEAKIKEFRSVYGTEFSERYLFYEVMKYSFNHKYIQFTGMQLDEMKITGPPDYYIRDNNTIFLFENKDALINAKIKENAGFEEMEKEFKKKFLEDGKSPKAIKQLVNNIISIIDGKNKFDDKYNVQHLKIYPILVVHDIMFDSAGFNYLLNIWFTKEIDELKKLRGILPVIKPLIVLNIDTLILISDALRNNKVTIRSVFDEYYNRTKVPTKKHYKSEADHKNKIAATFMPASIQIDNWMKESYPKTYPGRKLLEYAFKKFEKLDEL